MTQYEQELEEEIEELQERLESAEAALNNTAGSAFIVGLLLGWLFAYFCYTG